MSQTVIGPATRIAGALAGQDDLVVEGTVEGPIHGEAAVTIKVGARVGGAVHGRDVTIAGELQHPVFATGVVRLLATAKLTGDIEAPRISIDEGAVFEGQVRMRKPVLSAVAGPAPAATAVTARATPAPPPGSAPPPAVASPTVAPPTVTPPLVAPSTAPASSAKPPTPPAPPPQPLIVQSHNNMVQTQNNQLRAIPELAAPGRKRLIRKTP